VKLLRTFIADSVEDTERFAEIISLIIKPGDVVLLEGEIGSGKTLLVNRICANWEVDGPVTSPTFTIINQYDGPVYVNHLDFYRIHDKKELDHLGWEDLITDETVTFIEWPHWIEPLVDETYKIKINLKNGQRVFEVFHNVNHGSQL
jgi:tRNA threonylcarbamoyladenosine biosynthesis protein TsaE